MNSRISSWPIPPLHQKKVEVCAVGKVPVLPAAVQLRPFVYSPSGRHTPLVRCLVVKMDLTCVSRPGMMITEDTRTQILGHSNVVPFSSASRTNMFHAHPSNADSRTSQHSFVPLMFELPLTVVHVAVPLRFIQNSVLEFTSGLFDSRVSQHI